MKDYEYKTEAVKDKEDLESFLNSLMGEDSEVISVNMDQAHGGFIVVYKKPKVQLFND